MFQLQPDVNIHLNGFQVQTAKRYNREHLKAERLAQNAAIRDFCAMALRVFQAQKASRDHQDGLKAKRAAEKVAIKQLRAMTNAELNDLGINRGNIPEVVRYGRDGIERLHEPKPPIVLSPEQSSDQPSDQPIGAKKKRAISRGDKKRAINELRAMSDAQLEDIGVLRGDIKELVRRGRPIMGKAA